MKEKMIIGAATSFGTFGFYRGCQSYDYKYKQDIIEYNKKLEIYNKDIIKYPTIHFAEPHKPCKFYITGMLFGFHGSFLYVNPISAIVYFSKEIYIAEIYLRNLEDEKKTEFYNDPLKIFIL